MEKQFVTYDIASKLRDLEYDESCIAYFDGNKVLHAMGTPFSFDEPQRFGSFIPSIQKGASSVLVGAPLWQEAVDWLADKHNLHIQPKVCYFHNRHAHYTFILNVESTIHSAYLDYPSRREAIAAGIEEAFKFMKK